MRCVSAGNPAERRGNPVQLPNRMNETSFSSDGAFSPVDSKRHLKKIQTLNTVVFGKLAEDS